MAAEKQGWQVIGFRHGFEALLPRAQYITLDRKTTAGIMQQGGTILGTTSKGHFVAGGIAGGADIILLPEVPFEWEKVANAVRQRDAEGYLSTMIVVAESAKPKDGGQSYQKTLHGEHRLGGIGEIATAEVIKRTGKDSRCCVLGHLQRGGAPTTIDRQLGMQFGVKAVQLIAQRKFGTMVSYQHSGTSDVPIADAVNRIRLVDPNHELIATAREIGISFGD